jgi:hypothetical protein
LAHIDKRTISPGLFRPSLRPAPPFDGALPEVIQITVHSAGDDLDAVAAAPTREQQIGQIGI